MPNFRFSKKPGIQSRELFHRIKNHPLFPKPLKPGKRYRVTVHLNGIAQRFPKGHRLRLSLSTSYWPLAWPSPKPVQLIIYSGCSTVTLPVRHPRESDKDLRPFEEPEGAEPLSVTLLRPMEQKWRVIRDLAADISELEVLLDTGIVRFNDIGMEISGRTLETYTYAADEYSSLAGETLWERKYTRDDWEVRTVTRILLTSNETTFFIRADLDAYEGPSRLFSRSWNTEIPRNLL